MKTMHSQSALSFSLLAVALVSTLSACVKDPIDLGPTLTDTTEPVHWLSGSTIVVERLTKIDGPTLTIEPGVTIKCAPGASLSIGTIRPVKIVINGTAESPVVIQGEGMGGSYNGMLIDKSASGSRISHLQLEDVHSTMKDGAAMVVKNLNFPISNLFIKSDTNGLLIEKLSKGGQVAGLNVNCNGDIPLACPIQSVEAMQGLELSSPGAHSSVLLLPPKEKCATISLPKLEKPYCIDGVVSIDASTFQAAAGVTIYFKGPGALDFGCFEPCTLKCQGVRFMKHPSLTGPSRWAGITFNSKVSSSSTFADCTIAGAEIGAIFENEQVFNFTGNTISGCNVGVKAYSKLLPKIKEQNTFSGNVTDTETTRGHRGVGVLALPQ